MNFRSAEYADIPKICVIIEQAKKFLFQSGVDQWQKGYPNKTSTESDIDKKIAYVLENDGEIVATVAVSFQEEQNYAEINGKWKSIFPYAVIHRIAFSDLYRGRGVSSELIRHIENLCLERKIYTLRVDTHADNIPMNKTLLKNGFEYCGIVKVTDGDRNAYEKLLHF